MIKYTSVISTSLFGALTIAGCSGAGNMLIKNNEPTKVPVIEKTAPAVEKQIMMHKPGEEVIFGDFVVKINKVQDFETTNEFSKLADDMQLIAMEVEYNNRSGKIINSNPLDWSASDNEGFSYRYDLMMAKEPLLNRKIISPGGKVKGWITFQIPKTNKLKSMQFQPDLLENANVEFALQ